jgi:signal transduction histidine kinase
MPEEIVNIFLVIISFAAISVSCYLYFGPVRKSSAEIKRLRKSIEEIDEIVEKRVKERTKQLENMRDSISNFAVQRFELAQELEFRNISILEQKDITEKQSLKLREAYEEIKRLEIFRQQMVQMMIHDLKNPLNVILNLTDSEAIPARPKSIIRQISYEMLDHIINLLEVQKFREMKMKVENENIHLNSLVKSLTNKLSPLFVNASVEFKTSLPQTCWIKADRHIVNRVLINILSNAIKYTPSGGVIELLSYTKNDMILLEIRDNGSGIREDQIGRLFEMYNNGQDNDMAYSSSTGIGLAYCKLAVEALGGTIGISSESGKGTTVWFTLSQGHVADNIVQEDFSEATGILIPEIALSDEDKEELRPYIADLKRRDIYEVTEILSVTKKIACCENTSIIKWKELVEETLFSGNKKRFRELIEIDLQ